MSFEKLGLGDLVLAAVADAGYTTPTPIQEQAIPEILKGHDVLGVAQTGTGKTAGFTLPMIERLAKGRARARMPRTLILEPTRELATQVSENFDVYGKNHRLTKALLIGGVSFEDQNKVIDRGADVLIATPGRLLDHVERGRLLLRGVEILVIDEADRMLDMGFIPDVERIVSLTNPVRQTMLFSATMAPEIRRLADAFLKHPCEITVAPPASPAETVEQHLAVVSADNKREALRTLLRREDVQNALIFCNRKRDVEIVYKSLQRHGFNTAALHGDLNQSYRTQTLERFKAGEITFLVCSDVAARGLDIVGMSHVFLFDVPTHAEDYVHRIGRTGRAGRTGQAYTLAMPEDAKFVSAIEELIDAPIPRMTIDGMDNTDLDAKPRGRRRQQNGKSSGRTADKRSAASSRPRSDKGNGKAGRAKQEETAVTSRSRIAKSNGKPAKAPRQEAPAKPRRQGREKPVVGLGDHVPAFLMRHRRPPT